MTTQSENGHFNNDDFDWRPIRKQAKPIIEALGETERSPSAVVERMILRCGVDFVQELLDETLHIENEGGMMIADGSRRRTTGGVFFKLAKDRVADEDWTFVFEPRKTIKKSESKMQQPPKPPAIQNPQPNPQPQISQEIALRAQAEDLRRKIAEREAIGGAGIKMLRMMLEKVEAKLE